MIPETLAAALLWWWAARLRRRPGVPSMVRYVPLALIVAATAAWAISIQAYRAAEVVRKTIPAAQWDVALAPYAHTGKLAFAGFGAMLALAFIVLVACAALAARRAPPPQMPPVV